MNMPLRDLEGTWEQIAAQIGDLGEQRVRVLIYPVEPAKDEPKDADKRPIQEILAELAASVPPEEAAKLPPDFGDQLDHYIYGSPKR